MKRNAGNVVCCGSIHVPMQNTAAIPNNRIPMRSVQLHSTILGALSMMHRMPSTHICPAIIIYWAYCSNARSFYRYYFPLLPGKFANYWTRRSLELNINGKTKKTRNFSHVASSDICIVPPNTSAGLSSRSAVQVFQSSLNTKFCQTECYVVNCIRRYATIRFTWIVCTVWRTAAFKKFISTVRHPRV